MRDEAQRMPVSVDVGKTVVIEEGEPSRQATRKLRAPLRFHLDSVFQNLPSVDQNVRTRAAVRDDEKNFLTARVPMPSEGELDSVAMDFDRAAGQGVRTVSDVVANHRLKRRPGLTNPE